VIRAALVAVLLLALPAAAQDYPAPLSDTVSDYADLLPPAEEARLAARLAQARAETGVHIAVATIERKADHGGARQTIEGFATGWFNAWGIGDGARNDGILVLVARTDREMRIVLGAGYPSEWDLVAREVVQADILPPFREGRHAEGVAAGVEGTIADIARPFAAGTAAPKRDSHDWSWETLILFFGAFAVLMLRGTRHRVADLATRIAGRCRRCNRRGLGVDRRTITPAGVHGYGQGERLIRCPDCGEERREVFPIGSAAVTQGGDGDSGGGGGFGGGRSSGGGASGRW
jgi:uncharacterized protein